MALPATTYYVDVAVEDATIAPSYYCRLMHVSGHTLSQRAQQLPRLVSLGVFLVLVIYHQLG